MVLGPVQNLGSPSLFAEQQSNMGSKVPDSGTHVCVPSRVPFFSPYSTGRVVTKAARQPEDHQARLPRSATGALGAGRCFVRRQPQGFEGLRDIVLFCLFVSQSKLRGVFNLSTKSVVLPWGRVLDGFEQGVSPAVQRETKDELFRCRRCISD